MQLKKDDLEKAMEIKTFLEQNYKEHYDYDYLSKKFGINLLKLKYAFKEVSGESIHVYLTKVRVEKAKELFNEASKKFETFKPATELDPNWGRFALQYFLGLYK